MPNVIITPGFASLRAREKNLQYGALAGGLENASAYIAQALLTYSEHKRQEDRENLALLQGIISQYGASAGQEPLQRMDKLLQKRGLALPKDPVTGDVLPPPPTTDQLISKELAGNPDLLKEAAYKKVLGKSRIELGLMLEKIEATKAHQTAMEDLARTNANAHMISARASAASAEARAKESETRQATSLVQTPDGRVEGYSVLTEGGSKPLPEGSTLLNKTTAQFLLKKQQLEDENKLKKARIRADGIKAAHAFGYQAERALNDYMKLVSDPKRKDNKQIRKGKAVLVEALRNAGVSQESLDEFTKEDPKPESFWASIVNWYHGDHREAAAAVANDKPPPGVPKSVPIPGQIKLKSGKVLHEEVIPDEGQ